MALRRAVFLAGLLVEVASRASGTALDLFLELKWGLHTAAHWHWPELVGWTDARSRLNLARVSSLSAVWMRGTSTPPAQALACVAQAATGARPRMGASAASSAGTEPTTAPSAEAGALRWPPPSSWGRFSSARASSSPWLHSSTSSEPASCPRSSMEETELPPCSLAKPP
ncbi:uncharacterized protein C1orf159 homolog isoform X4 [Bos indicus]|uniref:Uncharacterized protein C1orf159 homolog isoform X4 n=1 Tax=Bos indicus TaxID=9915 RepID=A0ABM4QMJ7_BOSIN